MKKNIKRLTALTLSILLGLSQAQYVFASENPQGQPTIVVDIPKPDTTTTESTTTTTDENGNTTTTTTTVTEGKNDTSSYYEEKQDSSTVDSKGDLIKENGYVEGNQSHTEEYDRDQLELEFNDLNTDKELNPDTNSETVTDSTEGSTTITGDIKEGEDDKEYDQTTTEITSREVEGTIISSEVSVGDGDVGVSDDIEIGLDQLDTTYPEMDDMNMLYYDFNPDGDQPNGYDWYHSGYGADTIWGGKIVDEDTGEVSVWADILHLRLTNADTGENSYTYCADVNTLTQAGTWYTLENVEDADYYDEDAAKHIKAIVYNGYWGTESGTGSLTQMKQFLTQAKNSNPDALANITQDDIDNLTAGEAMAITQLAIWLYGNHYQDRNVSFTASIYNGNNDTKDPVMPNRDDYTDQESYEAALTTYNNQLATIAKINAIVNYYKTIEHEDKETEVITPSKFIKNIGLIIKDKILGHANNADDDNTNDAYNADLTFALEVEVSDKDDLIVKILDADGQLIKTVRLAGDNTVTGYDVIYPDANGRYIISGLELIEGVVSFNMVLEGAQYLEQGVYLYTSEYGSDYSQTFVGVAEGYKAVDLDMNVTFEFSVDDGTKTVTREWRSEYCNTYKNKKDTPEDKEDTSENNKPEVITITTNPQTGDSNNIVLYISLIAACIFVLVVLKIKNKFNE